MASSARHASPRFGVSPHSDEPDYKITQPMLLVHGDQDQTGDIKKIAPLWAAATPNCEYRVIPNALHMAPMDNPEFFNQVLMDFLAKWAP